MSFEQFNLMAGKPLVMCACFNPDKDDYQPLCTDCFFFFCLMFLGQNKKTFDKDEDDKDEDDEDVEKQIGV